MSVRQDQTVVRTNFTQMTRDEWLEADGLGGFASGTVSGIRTRVITPYSSQPPNHRLVD
jgi:hypothetical protein